MFPTHLFSIIPETRTEKTTAEPDRGRTTILQVEGDVFEGSGAWFGAVDWRPGEVENTKLVLDYEPSMIQASEKCGRLMINCVYLKADHTKLKIV